MMNNSYYPYGGRWYDLVRFNYTIMFFFTSLVSTLLPAFLFWGGGFWGFLDDVKINSLLGIFITCITAGFCLSRVLCYPGVNALSYMIPTVTAVYGILFGVLLLFRLEYSRPVIISSYILALVFCWLIYYLGERSGKVKYSIIPVGNYQKLCALTDVEWNILHKPNFSLFCGNAVVADFHSSDLTSEWQKLLTDFVLLGIPIYHSKTIYTSLTGRVSVEQLYENDLGSAIPSLFYFFLKRLADLLIVIVSLPFLMLVLLIVAILIKLESPGPVFFKQKRVGLGNKDFVMYKFRSMHDSSLLDNACFAQEVDKRITRFGHVIRKYRIDELPQFFNVLKGDMSLIGPRPEQRFFVERFESELPFYMYRHMVRPGISGWAQVMHGYSADTDSTRIKLEYDFYYIRNFSLWLDLLILIKTIKTMLSGFGAR
ncbi:sugar transferase [Aeromonas dhakensis]|uniref:sugar transferase n=1 Tax=Aeromonas dhakensis TaxID=196024 RepID=UPI0003FEE7D9|nr:sugar transferase [Aeromonas dhakensis]MBL0675094.1 sugar transferase [Aeromonas dhakensis]MDX7741194.1 sugar transferase [Aeromonas dhakensis]WAF99061.1 sugar transferase [Aeromonas dhakensis]HDZ8832625.1 sugar transferase [Aeromonas dhakensis]